MEKDRTANTKKRGDILDYLVWICIAWIVIWLVLKVLGIISTPLILEYSPAFAAVYIAGRAVQKLNSMEDIIRKIGADFRIVQQDFRKLETEHTLFTSKRRLH